jgi:hypothetical protein
MAQKVSDGPDALAGELLGSPRADTLDILDIGVESKGPRRRLES